ncbi:hypothetical protein CVT25_011724 [Psilocybe cyanescens]|uniref:Uncharacterized protein n=1 Tax=Psilocybe cyanescens TaxID=93625 RepID=A0A409WIE9_PSICY|nr:hypothetical protein CVT25_011724 [Psilocybe cyanescens]
MLRNRPRRWQGNEAEISIHTWELIVLQILLRPATPPVQKSSDIYFRHLSVKDHGYPLWIPEPNNRLPIQYQRQGIEIGDVGIITPSGSFDFLFNIRLPADNPINPPELPEQFASLHPPLDLIDIRGHLEFKPDSYLASSSIDRSQRDDSETPYVVITFYRNSFSQYHIRGLTFQSSASEGAILAMPNGAYSSDLGNITRFRKYMAANAEHWYRYVNGVRGREALNGEVRLVIGCHKTTTWGMATFADLRERKEFRLRFGPTGESSVGRTYGWDYTGMAEVRAGPDPQEIEALRLADGSEDGVQIYQNQCLFLRTLNVTLRNDIWDKLMAELELDLELEGNHSAEGCNLPPPGSTYSGNSIDSTGKEADLTPRSAPGANTLATTSTTDPPVLITGTPRHSLAHPSKPINEMLLAEKFEARMAITEDWDWMSILKEEDHFLPSSEDLCKRIREHYSITCDQEGVVYLHDMAENPLNNPDAATSIASDSKTWVFSDSPSHGSIALSGTTLESSSGAEDDGDLDGVDEDIRSLGLSRSRGGSVFVDSSPTVRNIAKVDGIAGTDISGIAEPTSIPSPRTTLRQRLVRKSKQQRTDTSETRALTIQQNPSPLRMSFGKLDEIYSTETTERNSEGHDDEAIKMRRRGLGRMLSLIRR